VKHFKLLSSSAPTGGAAEEPDAPAHLRDGVAPADALEKHLWRLEEAKKRDHRKLGRELDLFDFPRRRSGRAVLAANGMVLVREMEKFARESLDAHGYQEIATPFAREQEA